MLLRFLKYKNPLADYTSKINDLSNKIIRIQLTLSPKKL